MRFVLTRDPQEFGARARGFLEQRIECNVLATALRDVTRGRYEAGSPLFAYGLDGEEVRFAALRTPPMPMLTSELDACSADGLLELWLAEDPGLPGVNGPLASARAIAAAWAARTGGATHCRMGEAMHALDQVRDPPRPAPGALRAAGASERSLLLDWLGAFVLEAGLMHGDRSAEHLDARIARGSMFVWVDGGPVSMVGTQPPVAGVVRVGPVFTPRGEQVRAVHRSRQCDVEQDLRRGGLPPLRRLGRARLRARARGVGSQSHCSLTGSGRSRSQEGGHGA